jgi:spore coat protein A, manganese oxidase
MRNYLLVLLLFITVSLTAQAPLLDAVTHPKFQNPVPSPAKINVGATTTIMQMAQRTQWLGLVSPTNAQLQTNVWGYGLNGGTVSYPGPTLVANSNSLANVEWRNNLPNTHLLPVDNSYHKAMPAVSGTPTVVHLHGAHVEAASDGNPEAWYTPNYAEKGGAWTKNVYSYDNSQEGATLWYHDHALGMTRLNVYAGLAGFYELNDANDLAVSLPRNQYDRELVVQDKMFDNVGNLFFPSNPPTPTSPTPSGQPEFFGNFILVNGMVWPFMNVEPRKYRLRMLNGSDSRVYVFGLSNGASFLKISTDGGKLNQPVSITQLTLAPGERSDIIVDFSTMNGQQVTLLNTGPDAPFGNPTSPLSDPLTTGQIMRFNVNQTLNATVPDVNITTATNLRPTLGAIPSLGIPIKTRKLALFEGTDDRGRILPMLGIMDPTNVNDGSLSWHDPLTENINLNDTEIWEIYNTTADAHPVHLHLVRFHILSKQNFTPTLVAKSQLMHNMTLGTGAILTAATLTGVPSTFTPATSGWKDTHILMPGEMMKVEARFDRAGEYVWHCHILSHEDHDMMRRLVVANPCATDAIPPVLSPCPKDLPLTTTGTCTTATWKAPTATDNCTPNVVPTFTTMPTTGLTNGGCFPVGTTMVHYMAMDGNNNMTMCSFNVNVVNTNPCNTDITPPVLSACPSKKELTTLGTCTTASWTAPTAIDNCTTPVVSFTTSPTVGLTNGGCFPIGTTTVNYMAVDAQNNISTCFFIIKVKNTNPCSNDGTPPVFGICPPDINLVTSTSCATTTWVTPYATDNCSIPTITQIAGSTKGYCFQIGKTKITYQAADAKNNISTCSFNIKVSQANTCTTDATAPVFSSCPANINLTTTGTTAAATWTAPKATDNCSTPSVSFTSSPIAGLTNGGAYPIGITTIAYKAIDAKNNATTCSFTVTVDKATVCAVNFSATKCYKIVNVGSGKTLDVLNNGTALNTPIIQWTYAGTNNQQVRFTSVGSGYFKILFRNSGRYLANHSKSPNSNCYLYDYYLGGAKDWKIECLSNGYYKITHRLSNRILSVSGNSTADGAKTEIRDWDGSNAQQWMIQEVPCNTSSAYLLDEKVLTMDATPVYNRSKIQWLSNSGENTDYFVLQKLNEKTNDFEDLKVVNSPVKTNDLQYFTEYDDAPTEGANSYRIKLILADGNSVFSEIRTVIFNKSSVISIFPNPTESDFNIDLKSYWGQSATIYLYNELGELIVTKQVDKVSNDLINMDVSNVISGQYMVRIVSNGKKDFIQQVTVTH